MARTWLLLAAVAAVLASAAAAKSRFSACKWSDTYRYYRIVGRSGRGQRFVEKVKGDFINDAFVQAVKYTTARLRMRRYLASGCRFARALRHQGCYNSYIPGGKGMQYKGRYGFRYSVAYACPGKIRAFSCSIRLYTNRNNRLSHPSFWAPAMLSCGGGGGPSPYKGRPGRPRIRDITGDAASQVNIIANPPRYTGGFPILSYRVTATPRGGGGTIIIEGVGFVVIGSNQIQLSLPATRFDLNNIQFLWTITARNQNGYGLRSRAYRWPGRDLPSAPTITNIQSLLTGGVPGNIQITAVPPSDTGGSGIRSYSVWADPVGSGRTIYQSGLTYTTVGSEISVLVSQAVFNISGERAEWTLAAQNAVGLGRESDPYLWPTTGLASAPRIWYIRYAATGSPLQVAILVYPPSDDGGSAIEHYSVYATPVWGGSPIVIDYVAPISEGDKVKLLVDASLFDLQNMQYLWEVAADNAAGLGPYSGDYTWPRTDTPDMPDITRIFRDISDPSFIYLNVTQPDWYTVLPDITAFDVLVRSNPASPNPLWSTEVIAPDFTVTGSAWPAAQVLIHVSPPAVYLAGSPYSWTVRSKTSQDTSPESQPLQYP